MSFCRRIAIAVGLAFVSGCAEETPFSLLDDTTTTPSIYAALTPWASPKDPEAFKLIAVSSVALDPTSVKFCFGTAVQCQDPAHLSVAGVEKTSKNGRKYFEAEKFFRTSANLVVTIVAKDDKGAAVSQSVKIVTKGGALPPATPDPSVPQPQPGPVTPPPSVASACHKAPDDYTCQVEQEVVRLTNEKRQTQGLQPLQFDAKIGYVARLWSEDQASRGSIGHEWFSNGEWNRRYQQEFSEQSPSFAENVAQNMSGGSATEDARALVEAWWNSPGHKSNMLGSYTHLGVGFAKRGSMTYGTQNFGRR